MNSEERYRLLVRNGPRFWSRVDQSNSNGCWPWTGPVNADGYGLTANARAHRAAWILTHGLISSAQHVLHRCDNPPCCNPDHLFLGDQLINNADRDSKGRQCKGEERAAIFKAGREAFKARDPERYRKIYIENLRGENNPCAKLSPDEVRFIKHCGGTQKEVGAHFGISQTAVSKIRRGYRWNHIFVESDSLHAPR
jgi:hypothetical protein